MAEGISVPKMVQDPQMKDALQILRDGVMQDGTPNELPPIAKMSLSVRIKEQERAGLELRSVEKLPW